MEANVSMMIYLNDTNYHKWKSAMKYLLLVENLHLYVFVAKKPKNKRWRSGYLRSKMYMDLVVDEWEIMS